MKKVFITFLFCTVVLSLNAQTVIVPDDPNWDEDAWGTTFVYSSGARTLTSCGPDTVCSNGDDVVYNF